MSEYENLEFKIPVESEEYMKDSELVLKNVNLIIRTAIEEGRNKIFINTNLKAGIPMENINKIAGPFVEAWAYEIFLDVFEDKSNNYKLIGIEAGRVVGQHRMFV